jgi:hypothetical protein
VDSGKRNVTQRRRNVNGPGRNVDREQRNVTRPGRNVDGRKGNVAEAGRNMGQSERNVLLGGPETFWTGMDAFGCESGDEQGLGHPLAHLLSTVSGYPA